MRSRLPRSRVASLTYRAFALAVLALPAIVRAQTGSANWPVYGGNTDNTHYSTLAQISPANVKQLQVAWRYETHDKSAIQRFSAGWMGNIPQRRNAIPRQFSRNQGIEPG